MTYELAVEYLKVLDPRHRIILKRTINSICSPLEALESVTSGESLNVLLEGTIELIAIAAHLGTREGVSVVVVVDDLAARCEMTYRGIGFCACSEPDSDMYELHTEAYAGFVDTVLQVARARALGDKGPRDLLIPNLCADVSALAVLFGLTALNAVADHSDAPFEKVVLALALAMEDSADPV